MGQAGPAAWAAPFAIFLLIARAIAGSSLIFTGLTRLPMTAGWDNLLPAWFSRLHPHRRTPVRSILFVSALVMVMVTLSMLGVHEQEANQLLVVASDVHYAITYIFLFAIPVFGAAVLRKKLPAWLRTVSAAGMLASLVSLFIGVYPIVDVVSRESYAVKICGVVVVSNMIGVMVYRIGGRRNVPQCERRTT